MVSRKIPMFYANIDFCWRKPQRHNFINWTKYRKAFFRISQRCYFAICVEDFGWHGKQQITGSINISHTERREWTDCLSAFEIHEYLGVVIIRTNNNTLFWLPNKWKGMVIPSGAAEEIDITSSKIVSEWRRNSSIQINTLRSDKL